MSSKSLKIKTQKILDHAGITIDGDKPWDITVHNDNFYQRMFRQGTLGLGESYMDGWWDVKNLDQFFNKVLRANLTKKISLTWTLFLLGFKAVIMNRQSLGRAVQVADAHYNIGNDLYKTMLDRRMVYTCGYWKNALTLNEAQEAKLNLVCRKLNLKEGDRVLDIGCGFGGFAKYAAEKYGASVVGVTNSDEQARLARELCKGLSVEIRLEDYRDTKGTFDHIVSIGMFEAVGHKNYHLFMKTVSKLLKDDGLFLLHTIGGNRSVYITDLWIDKYIFPNGMLPSITQLGKAFEKLFVMEDWHNFGSDYDKTLMAWFKNFNKGWKNLESKYGKLHEGRFYRMWKYYLLTSAGAFRSRKNQLWQMVLSKKGIKGGYVSVR